MEKTAAIEACDSYALVEPNQAQDSVPIPNYLKQSYWWAYIHPSAVRFFERQWLINSILWGNFTLLRDAALNEIGDTIDGRILRAVAER